MARQWMGCGAVLAASLVALCGSASAQPLDCSAVAPMQARLAELRQDDQLMQGVADGLEQARRQFITMSPAELDSSLGPMREALVRIVEERDKARQSGRADIEAVETRRLEIYRAGIESLLAMKLALQADDSAQARFIAAAKSPLSQRIRESRMKLQSNALERQRMQIDTPASFERAQACLTRADLPPVTTPDFAPAVPNGTTPGAPAVAVAAPPPAATPPAATPPGKVRIRGYRETNAADAARFNQQFNANPTPTGPDPNLGGWWQTGAGAGVASQAQIKEGQDGWMIIDGSRADAEQVSLMRFVNPALIEATDWRLQADVTADGQEIHWRDGRTWRRVVP